MTTVEPYGARCAGRSSLARSVHRVVGQDGRCIEFARDVYRADVSSFELAVDIPPPL